MCPRPAWCQIPRLAACDDVPRGVDPPLSDRVPWKRDSSRLSQDDRSCCCFQARASWVQASNSEVVVVVEKAFPFTGRHGTREDDSFSVVVRFELPSGEEKDVTFFERPFGLRYAQSMPLTVSEVMSGSHAESVGVRLGWRVRKIGDVELRDQDFDRACQALQVTSKHLPLV